MASPIRVFRDPIKSEDLAGRFAACKELLPDSDSRGLLQFMVDGAYNARNFVAVEKGFILKGKQKYSREDFEEKLDKIDDELVGFGESIRNFDSIFSEANKLPKSQKANFLGALYVEMEVFKKIVSRAQNYTPNFVKLRDFQGELKGTSDLEKINDLLNQCGMGKITEANLDQNSFYKGRFQLVDPKTTQDYKQVAMLHEKHSIVHGVLRMAVNDYLREFGQSEIDMNLFDSLIKEMSVRDLEDNFDPTDPAQVENLAKFAQNISREVMLMRNQSLGQGKDSPNLGLSLSDTHGKLKKALKPYIEKSLLASSNKPMADLITEGFLYHYFHNVRKEYTLSDIEDFYNLLQKQDPDFLQDELEKYVDDFEARYESFKKRHPNQTPISIYNLNEDYILSQLPPNFPKDMLGFQLRIEIENASTNEQLGILASNVQRLESLYKELNISPNSTITDALKQKLQEFCPKPANISDDEYKKIIDAMALRYEPLQNNVVGFAKSLEALNVENITQATRLHFEKHCNLVSQAQPQATPTPRTLNFEMCTNFLAKIAENDAELQHVARKITPYAKGNFHNLLELVKDGRDKEILIDTADKLLEIIGKAEGKNPNELSYNDLVKYYGRDGIFTKSPDMQNSAKNLLHVIKNIYEQKQEDKLEGRQPVEQVEDTRRRDENLEQEVESVVRNMQPVFSNSGGSYETQQPNNQPDRTGQERTNT